MKRNFYFRANKNYIRMNIIVHSSNFYILIDEKITGVYKVFLANLTSFNLSHFFMLFYLSKH